MSNASLNILLLCNANFCFVSRFQSSTCVRVPPCRICRLDFRQRSRCNKAIPENQSLLLNILKDSPMLWLYAGAYFGQICALFWFWGPRDDDTTICAAFSDLLVWTETYKTVPVQANRSHTISRDDARMTDKAGNPYLGAPRRTPFPDIS